VPLRARHAALRDAESGGETKRSGHGDDDVLHPHHWSHARVVRWLEKLSSGKTAAVLPRDAFYNRLDGRTMTSMDVKHIFEAYAFTETDVVSAYLHAMDKWQRECRLHYAHSEDRGEHRCTVRWRGVQ